MSTRILKIKFLIPSYCWPYMMLTDIGDKLYITLSPTSHYKMNFECDYFIWRICSIGYRRKYFEDSHLCCWRHRNLLRHSLLDIHCWHHMMNKSIHKYSFASCHRFDSTKHHEIYHSFAYWHSDHQIHRLNEHQMWSNVPKQHNFGCIVVVRGGFLAFSKHNRRCFH